MNKYKLFIDTQLEKSAFLCVLILGYMCVTIQLGCSQQSFTLRLLSYQELRAVQKMEHKFA